jgi:Fe-S-cluster containining protein
MKAALKADPRSRAFGYICHRCSRCCYHKEIQVNPYEVARLARNLGQTTTEFRDAWTRDGAGNTLKQTENGACVFLGRDGCTVHADKPLVCRLYPLGRYLTPDGNESFVQLEGHPQSAGEFTNKGTIDEFLKSQGADPFIRAADDYYQWICAARKRLAADVNLSAADDLAEAGAAAADLLDMDSAIASHCTAFGTPEPTDIEDRKQLHLALLYEKLADYSRARQGET